MPVGRTCRSAFSQLCSSRREEALTSPPPPVKRHLRAEKAKSAAGTKSKLRSSPKNLRHRFDVQHLAAFIKPARRANTMRHIRRRALRAHAQLRQRHHTVICAPHPLTAARRFTLGYAHNSNKSFAVNFSVTACVRSTRRSGESKLQLIQFTPRRCSLTTLRGFVRLRGFRPGRVRQTGAIFTAQRMLRKRKQRIFPEKRR